MAWWDANSSPTQSRRGASLLPLSKSKRDLALGDAFPKLDIARSQSMPADISTMDHERFILSPISEEHFASRPVSPLAVHVNIQFTDPVIKSRYSRSYNSSQSLEPTDRICNGLVRRIEHCSQELLTRKDSTALDQWKDGSYEQKPMRFEITFRIVRRGMGEWAERTYRSYQKQPLTVGLTKDIILATHRMVGLFFRRHDQNFKWLDGPVMDHSPEVPETVLPSPDGPISLLCVPRSRFVESSQSFEFVPGYTIRLSFRSRNPRRDVPFYKRTVQLDSNQAAPLSLLLSEDILWKALHAINPGLDSKKHELDVHANTCRIPECLHAHDDALEIHLSISNNLGPLYRVGRDIKSNLSLFRDPEAKDCGDYLRYVETCLVKARDDADSKMDGMDDFEFAIVKLQGKNWSVRHPARFTLGTSTSYGRRTIQAAVDRIQTGIGDVLRGNEIAVQLCAYKRGHLILDKAIIAREKRGRPCEIFPSPKEQQQAFITRLKTCIQRDIDMVFKDTCSIDDIPEDDEPTRQHLPAAPDTGYFGQRSDPVRPSSPTHSPRNATRTYLDHLPNSPTRPVYQRSFSPSHRPMSSAGSIMSARNLDDFGSADMISESGSRRSSLCAQDFDVATPLDGRLLLSQDSSILSVSVVPESPTKPQRRFSLMPRKASSSIRLSSASTLISKNLEFGGDNVAQNHSIEGAIVKAGLLGTVGPLRSDGTLTKDKVDSMTLNEVARSDASDSARVVPDGVLGSLARDLTSKLIAHPEVMAHGPDCNAQEEPRDVRTQPTMDAFEDAQEYPAGLTLQPSAKIERLASPAFDDYSTAPSTPALSLGGDSSPRHSLLATPTYLRTLSGTKNHNLLRDIEPESEPKEPGADTMEADEMDASLSSKGGDEFADVLATERSSLSPTPPRVGVILAPELVQEDIGSGGPDIDGPESKGNNNKSSEQLEGASPNGHESDPTATGIRLVVPSEGTEPPAGTTPTDNSTPPALSKNEKESENEAPDTQNPSFGSEGVAAEPDVVFSQRPDFPTHEVRSGSAPTSHKTGFADTAPTPGDTSSEANSASGDGTELLGSAVASNPFGLLVEEVEDADLSGHALEPQDDAGDISKTSDDQNVGPEVASEPVNIDFADIDNANLSEPSATVPDEVSMERVSWDANLAGSEIPTESPSSEAQANTEVRNESESESEPVKKSELAVPEDQNVPEPGQAPGEDTLVDPVGSAVKALEAELLNSLDVESAALEFVAETEAADLNVDINPRPAGAEASDSAVITSETETDAPEKVPGGVSVINEQSILNDTNEDTETAPEDIGIGEVAQPQPEVTTSEETGQLPAYPEEPVILLPEDVARAVVGVLDENIGTEPESHVHASFQFPPGGGPDGDERLPVSTRRASELGEDICGHEYSTGNRVGYAAVCVGLSEEDTALVDDSSVHVPYSPVEAETEQQDEGYRDPIEPPAVLVVANDISDFKEPDEAARGGADLGDRVTLDKVMLEEVPATLETDEIPTGNEIPGMEDLAAEILEELEEHVGIPSENGIPEANSVELPKFPASEQIMASNSEAEAEAPAIVLVEGTIPVAEILGKEAPEAEFPCNGISENIPLEAEIVSEVLVGNPEALPVPSVADVLSDIGTGPDSTLAEPSESDLPDLSEMAEFGPSYVVGPGLKVSELSPLTLQPVAPPADLADFGFSPRVSIDTLGQPEDDFDLPLEMESVEKVFQCRPQTAGHLGLGESRLVKVGLWGGAAAAFGDIRRYSLPLQSLIDGTEQEHEQEEPRQFQGHDPAIPGLRKGKAAESRQTWATLTKGVDTSEQLEPLLEDQHRRKRQKHHNRKPKPEPKPKAVVTLVLTEESSAEKAIYEGPLDVPRMMLLVAGVMAIGKVFKGQAVN